METEPSEVIIIEHHIRRKFHNTRSTLVSTPTMGVLRLVDAKQFLSHRIVAMVLYVVGCDITVIMAPLPMVTVAMSVLHTQIQPLGGWRYNIANHYTHGSCYIYMHSHVGENLVMYIHADEFLQRIKTTCIYKCGHVYTALWDEVT